MRHTSSFLKSFTDLVTVGILATSCMDPPKALMSGEGTVAHTPGQAMILNDGSADGVVVARVSALSSETQTISSSGSEDLADVQLSIPPGALGIDVSISVESGMSIANLGNAVELGLENNNFVLSAPAVMIASSIAIQTGEPMTLSVPAPKSASLNLMDEGTLDERIAILFRVSEASAGVTTGTLQGLIPRSEIMIKDGKVFFETKRFGIFQAVVTEKKIEAAIVVRTEKPIISKREEITLPPAQWQSVTYSVSKLDRILTVSTSLLGVESVKDCVATIDDDKALPFQAVQLLASKTEFSKKIALNSAHTLFARFDCVDNHGRSLTSPWTELTIPVGEEMPKVTTNRPTTIITQKPGAFTSSASNSIQLSCSTLPCTYEYRIDSGSWIKTTLSTINTILTDGAHTFEVKAIDQFGAVSSQTMTATWVVDTVAPKTPTFKVGLMPSDTSFTETIIGSSADASFLEFRYRFDSPLLNCQNGMTTNGPVHISGSGPVSLYVIACDKAGNSSSIAMASYAYSQTPPLFGNPVPVGASLTISPANIYTSITNGSSPGNPVTFTVTNSGTGPTAILHPINIGNPSRFGLINNYCSGSSLGAGGSCSFDVFPQSSSNDPDFTSSVGLSDGNLNTAAVISGSASGFDASLQLSGNPTFALTGGVSPSSSQVFTLTNTGPTPTVQLSAPGLFGNNPSSFEIVGGNCVGVVLNPASSCEIHVQAKATTNATFDADLKITAGAVEATIYLSGTATGFAGGGGGQCITSQFWQFRLEANNGGYWGVRELELISSENPVAISSTVTSSSSFNPLNLSDQDSASFWQSSFSGIGAYIIVDLGAPTCIDAVMFNLTDSNSYGSVAVETGPSMSGPWNSVRTIQTNTYNVNTIYPLFDSACIADRFWRVIRPNATLPWRVRELDFISSSGSDPGIGIFSDNSSNLSSAFDNIPASWWTSSLVNGAYIAMDLGTPKCLTSIRINVLDSNDLGHIEIQHATNSGGPWNSARSFNLTAHSTDVNIPIEQTNGGSEILRSVEPGRTTPLQLGNSPANGLSISGNIATFAMALNSDVGPGDVIQYDSNNDSIKDSIASIRGIGPGRMTAQVAAIRSINSSPTSTSASDTDWEIFRAYTGLQFAFNGLENPGIIPALGNFDFGFENLSTLGSGFAFITYPSTIPDSPAHLYGWVTTPNYGIHIASPKVIDANYWSMSPTGIVDDNKYRIVAGPTDPYALRISVANVGIHHMQIFSENGSSGAIVLHIDAGSTALNEKVEVDSSIIVGSSSADGSGIYANNSNLETLYLQSNVVSKGGYYGIRVEGVGIAKVSNSTLLFQPKAMALSTAIPSKLANNLALDCYDYCYHGVFDSTSMWNAAQSGAFVPGQSQKYLSSNDSALYVVDPNINFHLGGINASEIDSAGGEPSNAGISASREDIDGVPRGPGVIWDIGADQN